MNCLRHNKGMKIVNRRGLFSAFWHFGAVFRGVFIIIGRYWIFVLLLIPVLMACTGGTAPIDALPTAADPAGVQTAVFITQNAPPPGFEQVAFEPIDVQRERLPGSYFEVT